MFSIDQNCHPLWDVIPKLHALARHGHVATHFIEDIDVAFTAVGSQAGEPLRLARERYYRSGGADWGAALFYFRFLGRLPVEIRNWEPLTGMKTHALAHQLETTVDDLYEQLSPSDNWQLIGPSYAGDSQYHRVIGDVRTAETADPLRRIMDLARQDCLERFPDAACRRRAQQWFAAQADRLEQLLDRCRDKPLVELYRLWMDHHVGAHARIDMTSTLLAAGAPCPSAALLEMFLRDYDLAAGLYNEALAETSSELRPLRTGEGELPLFASLRRGGHWVRCGMFREGGVLRVGDQTFAIRDGRPAWEELARGGILTLAGKAIVLVLQVRLGPAGEPLALPYQGSLYMPAANRLAAKLAKAGLLPGRLSPVYRVRLRLLDRLADLPATLRLPEHLAESFGREELPCNELAGCWREVQAAARARLARFADPAARQAWLRENFADAHRQIDDLDARRRDLAGRDAKSPEIRELGKHQRSLQRRLLHELVRQIARDTHAAAIDYWDSRGALLPWCVALGGEEFYRHVIDQAEIYPEPHSTAQGNGSRP